MTIMMVVVMMVVVVVMMMMMTTTTMTMMIATTMGMMLMMKRDSCFWLWYLKEADARDEAFTPIVDHKRFANTVNRHFLKIFAAASKAEALA